MHEILLVLLIALFCQNSEQAKNTMTRTLCDPRTDIAEHPICCNKFLRCQEKTRDFFTFVEQTCGPDMLFNPVTLVCDWPAQVISIKPECDPSYENDVIETKFINKFDPSPHYRSLNQG